MIKDILTENLVDVNVHASDWEEAVRIAGNLLYKNDFTEKKYIDHMVSVVKELGPYIVLIKGVALAHARPEHGAKKIGVSLITLDPPICFGHEQHDPVKIVFALSAVDNSSHLELISEMGKLFDSEKTMNDIASSKTKEELLSIISNATEK